MSGQAEHGGRKRSASVHVEGRPPKLPPTPPAGAGSPVTPELAGTNISFPSFTDSQSPPSGAQEGNGGGQYTTTSLTARRRTKGKGAQEVGAREVDQEVPPRPGAIVEAAESK